MKYNITSMNEDIAKEISNWKYEGEYGIYNTESFEEMKKKQMSLVNPEKSKNYMCFFDSVNNNLIAYINILKKDNEDIFIGIGLKPDFCGKGLGAEILNMGIEEAISRYPNNQIVLQVRSWNQRAIKCYVKSGFCIEKTETILDHNGNETEFVFMKYNK